MHEKPVNQVHSLQREQNLDPKLFFNHVNPILFMDLTMPGESTWNVSLFVLEYYYY